MNTHFDHSSPKIIYGLKAGLIRYRLKLLILLSAIRISRNPFQAVRKMRKVGRLRAKVHGTPRITKFVKSGGKYYWVADYPGLFSENFKYLLKGELRRTLPDKPQLSSGLIPMQTVIWGITNRCPLQCRHCYDWENLDSKDHLTLEQLRWIRTKMIQQGIRHIQLSGGEPLARFEDLILLIQETSSEVDYWLLTSGFKLTEEKAGRLRKAGLKGVNISLDHWREEEHNQFRNHLSSFDWATKAVHNCREAGIMVSLSLCATREFVTEENLTKYGELAHRLGAHFIRILEPRQVGRFADVDVQLERDQLEMLSQFAFRMNTDTDFCNYPIVVFYGFHQRLLGCFGAGNRYLYVDANGDFHACPFCRGSVGNILTDSFNQSIVLLRERGCHAFKTTAITH